MNSVLLFIGLSAQLFEVASVKPYKGTSIGNQFRVAPNGDLRAVNFTLRELVRTAFGLHETQVGRGPKWFGEDRWNIEAKVGEGAQPDSSRQTTVKRLRALLIERFQLEVHRETQLMTVLALAQAKGGAKLKPAIPGEESVTRGGRGALWTKSSTLEGLSDILSGMLGRIVVNQTGLTGAYSFDLQWAPDAMTERLPGQPANMAPTDPVAGPSIYSALQNQLGLKLVTKNMPVEILIIDRASRPTEN